MDKVLRKEISQKLYLLLLAIAGVFLLFGLRLFYLQIQSNDLFSSRAERNMVRMVDVEATRGDIIGQDGFVYATSKPAYQVSLDYLKDDKERERALVNLGEILEKYGTSEEDIREKVKNNARKFEATEIISMPWGLEAVKMFSELSERRDLLPGVVLQTRPVRTYPAGPLAGHILGHMGAIGAEDVDKYASDIYGPNDRVGKAGIEKVFEVIEEEEAGYQGLKGDKGIQQYRVDSLSRPVQEMDFRIQPLPGDSVVLTLDVDLQRSMEEAMDQVIASVREEISDKAGSGAGVLIDVSSGKILAMTSRPAFNPEDFVDGLTQAETDYYYRNRQRPEINKAVSSVYPPGSTFKMITGMAYLEKTKASAQSRIRCQGAYWEKPYIRCWNVHGNLNYVQAIGRSCNVFFQDAGKKAGIDKISQVAREFGLGVAPGLDDLTGVSKGFLPSPQRKKDLQEKYYKQRLARYKRNYDRRLEEISASGQLEKDQELARTIAKKDYESNVRWAEDVYRFEQNWQPYDTFNTSIGQGMNEYSMLQLANYVATLANGGTRYQPYLVEKIISPDGQTLTEHTPQVIEEVSVSPEVIKKTQEGMREVVRPGGTSYFLFKDFPVPVAAKTGTAQTGRVADDKSKEFHGLYVAYAPYDDPQVAFAGVVEYGESGGGSAGIVARAVFAEYFGEDDYKEVDADYYVTSPLLEE